MDQACLSSYQLVVYKLKLSSQKNTLTDHRQPGLVKPAKNKVFKELLTSGTITTTSIFGDISRCVIGFVTKQNKIQDVLAIGVGRN